LKDLVESLKYHDGSGVVSLCEVPHYGAFFLWTLQDILGVGRMFTQLSQEEVAANDDNEFWRPSWLPFAANGAGDCLFVDSTSNDHSSSLSLFDHELRTTTLLWPSILAMLTDVANDLIDGVFQP
jgi:cell wall assembly regulator SMI1